MCEKYILKNKLRFFQNEKKFVVGKSYETLRVIQSPYYTFSHEYNYETCDEKGNIVSESEKFLGTYIKSENYGYGDNGGRKDYFINKEGETVVHLLHYDGTTRYREVKTNMDERIDYLMTIEGIGNQKNIVGKNEHINKYLLNNELTKEICTFMNPLI